jgi:beta-N-acetylhexosaminidase
MSGAEFVFVGIPGRELDDATARLLARHPPGGVVLFARNVGSAEELRSLVAALRALLPEALLAIDAEGGRVDRLRSVVGPTPGGTWLARRRSTEAAVAARWIGRALRLFDLDVNFAPVVDLDRGERGNALDGRYLGRRPARIVPRARAFLGGLHASGVGGCLKHFPGLGAAAADTHLGVARIALPASELATDLEPFVQLGGLAGAVMVGHAIYPAYDPEERPASLSPAVVEELLGRRLGFEGLRVADDLEMEALAPWGELPQRAEAAFAAGCDVLPVCSRLDALEEIAARLEAPRWEQRRRAARERLGIYRGRLTAIRGAPPIGAAASFTGELGAVRQALAALSAEA